MTFYTRQVIIHAVPFLNVIKINDYLLFCQFLIAQTMLSWWQNYTFCECSPIHGLKHSSSAKYRILALANVQESIHCCAQTTKYSPYPHESLDQNDIHGALSKCSFFSLGTHLYCLLKFDYAYSCSWTVREENQLLIQLKWSCLSEGFLQPLETVS